MAPTTNVLITGAAGFVGQVLAAKLLDNDSYRVTLTDVILPPIPKGVRNPQYATAVKADLCDASSLNALLSTDLDAVYVFHGIMSSGSEANYELGLRVNFDATRALLDAVRLQVSPNSKGQLVRIVYASSGAIYGQPIPSVINDSITPTPESSYGTQKLMCELLINDMTRKGFIDGLCLRFPTIAIRAGRPTQAASSFLSGMIREPLNGEESVLPIEDRSYKAFMCSPRILVENLVKALTVDTAKLPKHLRTVNLPGTSSSVQEMVDALEEVGGKKATALLKFEKDPATERILYSWASDYDTSKAESLGFVKDDGIKAAVREYKASLEEK